MLTHSEVEAQVSIGCGVQEGRAHSSLALLLKDQRQSRLDLSALRPEHSAIYVPAEERKGKGTLLYTAHFLSGLNESVGVCRSTPN